MYTDGEQAWGTHPATPATWKDTMRPRPTAALSCLTLAAIFASQPAAQAQLFGVGSGVGDFSSNLYVVSNLTSTPSALDLGELGFQAVDVAIDPSSGRMYALDFGFSQQIHEINPATAAATPVGFIGAPFQNALDFDSHGNLYSWGNATDQVFTIDLTTGAATLVGSTGGFLSGGDLAFDLDGRLYGATLTSLVEIDVATGAGTLVGSFGPSSVFGLEIDADGRMYAFEGNDNGSVADAYSVDKTTGAATFIGTIANAVNLGLYGVSFQQTCGFTSYGAGPLSLEWTQGSAPNHTQGTLSVSGATPSGAGALIASFGDADAQAGSLNLLVDVSPGVLVTVVPVPFDVAGSLAFPLSISLPSAVGIELFIQAVDAGPPILGSNGLSVRFCP